MTGAALAPVSERCVYGGVAEVSVYVAAAARGAGAGSALLAALVAASEREGLWTLQAGAFPEKEKLILEQLPPNPEAMMDEQRAKNDTTRAEAGAVESISAYIIRWSHEYPSIPFLVGFVAGHLFWRMDDKSVGKE